MVRNPLDVPHALLKPLRRHCAFKVPVCGAAAPLWGSPYCPLLGVLEFLLLNAALLGQDGYGGGQMIDKEEEKHFFLPESIV